MSHFDICHLVRTSEDTLRAYLRQHQEQGVERHKRTDRFGPASELFDRRQDIEEYHRLKPRRSTSQAAADIEQLTGIRRWPTLVDKFLEGLGLKVRKLGIGLIR